MVVLKKFGLVVTLAALSGAASAKESCKIEHFLWIPVEVCTSGGDGDRDHRSAHTAPEMSSASAAAGLTLALGGLAVLRGRRSRTATATRD